MKETHSLPVQTTPAVTGPAALNGKKIIFIGNSYTFYGQAVLDKGNRRITQEERSNDQGFFYQICKNNHLDVAVTNWTFGGHNVIDICGEECMVNQDCKGEHHPQYLTDTYFDYVAIQCYNEARAYTENLVEYLKFVTDVFRASNPNVKFLLLVPHMAAEKKFKWIGDLADAKKNGFIVCNWGQMLDDICNKVVAVPGATLEYKRSTFVVGRAETDGHHQNLLAGYLTALMTYCAITGESAVGQEYSFCDDNTIQPSFGFEKYRNRFYVYAPETNFIEVFRSDADMKGLQQLIDLYLSKY